MKYSEFFEKLTGNPPFPYQELLGKGPWPQLLDVPTGLGKTAAAVVSWMFQVLQGEAAAGQRLVYCLPMRVLVSQTRDSAAAWCTAAAPLFEAAGLATPTVHVLMGGDLDQDWENHPERPCILIGTQDLLLSRALNRGYAMSRYKWPVHFALLNNDCSWVFDETQLVGVGIETSAQLAGLRQKLGLYSGCRTLWMSATLGGDQLDTVDHPKPSAGWSSQGLTPKDHQHKLVKQRVHAEKPIEGLEGLALSKQTDGKGYIEGLSDRIVAEHTERGGLTLVILNRVPRAQELYKQLRKADGRTAENTALVHSRFRAADRRREESLLQGEGDRIVVATQAVEAGVDVSARTMFTELAPWPSLVQRFGRCNRYGEGGAKIIWCDIDASDSKTVSLPYEADDLSQARQLLTELSESDAGPQSLSKIDYAPPSVVRPVLRRRDLLDLFDTSPDLCGNDIDISRYVRDGEDNDVQIYWRDFTEEPTPDLRRPSRDELCRVSIAAARDFVSKKLPRLRKKLEARRGVNRALGQAWTWNPLEAEWQAVDQVYPGQMLLLHPSAGGYDERLGWTAELEPKTAVPTLDPPDGDSAADEALDSDPDTALTSSNAQACWVQLKDHLAHVRDEAATLAAALGLAEESALLSTAGLWHDVGKAHEAFQHKLLAPTQDRPDLAPGSRGIWAKSPHQLPSKPLRTHFRHELASALAWLELSDSQDPVERDLIAYLIAAHHGKVRLSLRSAPGESPPKGGPNKLFARGVWEDDVLPAFELPDARRFEAVKLDLTVMKLGEGSWLERMLQLRDSEQLGPFRLALLETVVRIADWRASRKEEEQAYAD